MERSKLVVAKLMTFYQCWKNIKLLNFSTNLGNILKENYLLEGKLILEHNVKFMLKPNTIHILD
jgi:hypothetical protein